jgi:cytochrome d ubiquinol oxidase subunit II
MMTLPGLDLPLIWGGLIAIAVLAYVLLDGFDLGVGILFLWEHGDSDRDVMVNSIAPVWDGNETWLVLGGGGLLAVFPLAYATILPALYPSMIGMLLALVFRGVAFEFRFRTVTTSGREWWDRAFCVGSAVAALCQGLSLGGLLQGIHVENRAYAGGWLDWLDPFTVLCGVSLVVGYALLGACWLIWRTEGPLRDRCYRHARVLGLITVALIGAGGLAILAGAVAAAGSGAVHLRAIAVRAVLRGPCDQFLPLYRAALDHPVAGRRPGREPGVPAGRHGGAAADHPGLYVPGVLGVSRQGEDRRALSLGFRGGSRRGLRPSQDQQGGQTCSL